MVEKKNSQWVDLSEDATYVVKEGSLTKISNGESGFGKQIISWSDHKPVHVEIRESQKL